MQHRVIRAIAVLCAPLLAWPTASRADEIADFYKGRTVEMYIGYSPGGGYDLYARLVARHLGRHLPGNPGIVAKNMPGGGGMTMTNWFYNAAPRDGSALASAPQALAIEQALGAKSVKYDSGAFNWIGRVAPVTEISYTWHSSATRTLKDALKRVTPMGASGKSSPTATHLLELNGILGTKFKPVLGYKGSTGANLAMQQGEVEGATKSWASFKVSNADWLREKKVHILVQYALEKDPDLPDVPLMADLAKTADDRRILEFFAVGNGMGRTVMAPPGVPAARVAALRKAFMATMADPALIAEAGKLKIALGAMPGEKLQALVRHTLDTPSALLDRARAVRGR